jgi:hypothetical protein
MSELTRDPGGGRVVIVGASSGIGRVLALRCAGREIRSPWRPSEVTCSARWTGRSRRCARRDRERQSRPPPTFATGRLRQADHRLNKEPHVMNDVGTGARRRRPGNGDPPDGLR